MWPSISEQADQLAKELPAAVRELRGWFEQREWGRWLLGRAEPDQMADGGALVNQATGVLLTTISALAALLIILFVGLYVSAQPSYTTLRVSAGGLFRSAVIRELRIDANNFV